MARDLARPAPPGIEPLIEALAQRYRGSLQAVVLYGSCRRNSDPTDGLVDLMAVVSDYRRADASGAAALVNAVLPPNVYYLEAEDPDTGRRLRCKYIVIRDTALLARCRGGLDAYFWARFSQPCRLVWSDGADEQLARARAAAAVRFAGQAARLGGGVLTSTDFWTRALAATYACELRPEPPGAARALVEAEPEYWTATTALVAGQLPVMYAEGDDRYRIECSGAARLAGRCTWALRRVWGKTLNLARLFKAAGTFANGLDYLVWKVERHSGVRIEPTERMRRHPRLAAWGLAWKLWRQGAFR